VFGSEASHRYILDRLSLLTTASELWVFSKCKIDLKNNEYELPDHIAFDLYYWLLNKTALPIRVFSWQEAGVPKYSLDRKWALTEKERRENMLTASRDGKQEKQAIMPLETNLRQLPLWKHIDRKTNTN